MPFNEKAEDKRLASSLFQEVVSYCRRYSDGLSQLESPEDCIEFVRAELPPLLLNTRLFAGLLECLLEGLEYPDLRRATMFDNELLLYADKERLFSLRMFLWGPGEYTPVHDHNAWGVIGPVSGELDVANYTREEARVVATERFHLAPGDTVSTLPLDDGIHKIGNPTGETMISLSLYGKPLPRGYINGFDPDTGRVYRIVAPKIKKKLLALQALDGIDSALGEAALNRVREGALEIFRSSGDSHTQ